LSLNEKLHAIGFLKQMNDFHADHVSIHWIAVVNLYIYLFKIESFTKSCILEKMDYIPDLHI
jgi:hypothetical protein